ncbi:GDNF family receptor alpha-1 [Echinops telfairi]|uniref:GDNF family receptor alpha-1 n=1 Tax=Echinops telfairi TaxID=9371 RepID=A0ABM0ZPY2_ECHTE|nr:GDNF family receptor alpha-1 [Echinops telfairi]
MVDSAPVTPSFLAGALHPPPPTSEAWAGRRGGAGLHLSRRARGGFELALSPGRWHGCARVVGARRGWTRRGCPGASRGLLADVLLSAEVSGGDRLDCVKASDQCLKEQSCSTKYRTLRQCVAGKETNFSLAAGLEAKDECRSAMEALKQKSLYNCRCKRGMKKEKNCLRIYWSMYQSLQGNDLLEDSPYEPVNSRLSDIFRVVPFIPDVFQQVEHISKGNNCLDAAKACNLDDTCKKYRSAYITPCTSSMSNEVCNRRKCHKALRQFFDKVPAKHSYGMLFCSCRDIACTERRRQTIVPVCSYEEREKPNCLSLQDSCKTNYICRSRLADFFTNCQPEPRSVSGCLKENYADCLLAYSGLIENAIQAFGNGSDVTVWQPALPVQTTTATTSTAFRGKNKPLGPAGSENEIPTHMLPPCANLQAQKLKSNVSGSTHLCLSDRDYEKDGLSGASSHITTKSTAAPPCCPLSPLLVPVVTGLLALLSASWAETS